jgi:plasmid rolling circle replication initiator protein Rep
MKGQVWELEKECLNMKAEIEKLRKTKQSWTILARQSVLVDQSQNLGYQSSKLNPKIPKYHLVSFTHEWNRTSQSLISRKKANSRAPLLKAI